MTDPERFDPVAFAARCRAGLIMTIDDPPADLEPSGRGRIAAFAVNTIVSAWLVGEGERVAASLDRATAWLAAAETDLGDEDREGWFGVRRRRRALATARWLRGEPDGGALAGAAASGLALLAEEPERGAHALADQLCDLLLAGNAAAALALVRAHPPEPSDLEAVTAAGVAKTLAAGEPHAAPPLMRAFGRVFAERLAVWLSNGAFQRLAVWCRLAFDATDLSEGAIGALWMSYPYLRGIAVPPALAERGWRAGEEEVLVEAAAATVERVGGLALAAGLPRDADAVSQDAADPAFASWTGQGDDRREIDWHREGGETWLEIRGPGGGILAGAMAAALGGTVTRANPAEFANQSAEVGGTPTSAGGSRWQRLRAALASADADAGFMKLAIAAGLGDPDWRVRMTAVIAVGRLALKDLAPAALKAAVPEAGVDGLDQEDRRMLLALRHAAHDLAAETQPTEGSQRRLAHQARLRERIAHLPQQAEDRADALLLGLWLGRDGPRTQVPGHWRRWLDP